MPVKQPRPAFIFAIAGDLQGCGFHRIQTPLASLVGVGVADGRIDMQFWPVEAIRAVAPDTVVFQRQLEDGQLEQMRLWREALPNALFVYELDDNIGEVPTASFHAGFMPPNLSVKLAEAMAICDRVTTSTEPLAEWMRGLGAQDVRVVPNGLPLARLNNALSRPKNTKLRIGFAGGVSHKGDLEFIRHAMTEIGDKEVEWVFFGMQPENPPCAITFIDGVAPIQYLDKLRELNIDLLLAPLEDNQFNRCKSNLRLIESASAGACVIAQRYTPYLNNSPPVFAYAETPEEWLFKIQVFLLASDDARDESAKLLNEWARKHYTLESTLRTRMEAWLPNGTDSWRPQHAKECLSPVMVATLTANLLPVSDKPHFTTLVEACEKAIEVGADVLWARPGTSITDASWDAMRLALVDDPVAASVIPLATDGPNAFPKEGWTPMSNEAFEAVSEIVAEVNRGRVMCHPGTTGPLILLNKTALAMGGIPDVDGCDGNEEVAILEWGMRLTQRGWHHVQVAAAFAASQMPPVQPNVKIGYRFQGRAYHANIQVPSEVLAGSNRAEIELRLLRKQWGGLRPGYGGMGADYAAWRALHDAVVADIPLASSTLPIKVHEVNCDDKESALKMGSSLGSDKWATVPPTPHDFGDWVLFTDNSTKLDKQNWQNIYEGLNSVVTDLTVKVVYWDHDILMADGTLAPCFKPGFDETLFLGADYITPCCAMRVQDAVGLPFGKTALFAGILHLAHREGVDAIKHIATMGARVSCSADYTPEKIALDTLQRKQIIEAEYPDVEVTPHKQMFGCLNTRFKLAPEKTPKVSFIILTMGAGRLIQPCVNTLLQNTKYQNIEVIIGQNGAAREEPELGGLSAADPRIKVVKCDSSQGFNWAKLNNYLVQEHTAGDYLCFMNDDVQCASLDGMWLEHMLGRAESAPDIGCVGAKLVHPMGVLQHVGVVYHNGLADHPHCSTPNGQVGWNGIAVLPHENTAVTGACMLVSRECFHTAEGFDEQFALDYNDTDFCLALRAHGLRHVVETSAELLHTGAATRGPSAQPNDVEAIQAQNTRFTQACIRLIEKWGNAPDHYWNINQAWGRSAMNGGRITGANCDTLVWEEHKPSPDAERVLIINDAPGIESQALKEMQAQAVPFMADLSGFKLRLTAPPTLNIAPWDIRQPRKILPALQTLGITRVVLCSYEGGEDVVAPVEALRGLLVLRLRAFVPDPVHGDSRFEFVDTSLWGEARANLEKQNRDLAAIAKAGVI